MMAVLGRVTDLGGHMSTGKRTWKFWRELGKLKGNVEENLCGKEYVWLASEKGRKGQKVRMGAWPALGRRSDIGVFGMQWTFSNVGVKAGVGSNWEQPTSMLSMRKESSTKH
jgi:hypothetical protein